MHLNVRTDDGFAGDCNVEDSTLGPDHPTSSNQIASTRIEG
ncbi:hypothetical protein [Nannocystis radixulma]|uniref:Uncharacterized protein n=1 Tax=Nannocystis radixulma TaxID=2995305 RepID=A0ABT5BDY5_9BACT|nr:hypothetical protein [Nannocystis radixulma]MDC0672341.1 hypothetical protein [Nannocystis radixulma]